MPESSGARGPQLVAIEDIRREGLRQSILVLPHETRLEIESEGLKPGGDGYRSPAQGWILDLETRRPVWTQDDLKEKTHRGTENVHFEDEITLPAGTYGVCFGAFNGRGPLAKDVKFFGFNFGKIEVTMGGDHDWDEEGDPDSWGIWVYSADRDVARGDAPAEIPPPFADAIVRELGLGNDEYHEVRVDLDREVEFHLWATGEVSNDGRSFADNSWIIDLESWERVWELELTGTEPYGGARKNRVFDGRLRMPAGSYLVSVATDPSHATGSWNDLPPWDPSAWGLALSLVDVADRPYVQVNYETARPASQIQIAQVGSEEFEQVPFVVDRKLDVLVRAMGEKLRGDSSYADYGWLERQSTFEEVWRMDDAHPSSAGGSSKNRLVEEVITLEPGGYNLCYVTDDSHAYGDWNQSPPFDPSSWGISLATLNAEDQTAIREAKVESETAVISLAPVRDDEHVSKRFQTVEPTRVRILAVGEGQGGKMYDYGWLENQETGKKVWKMSYKRTDRAGGARKNRQETVELDLLPGVYELHYKTDGEHAFGDWNADPPRRPQLWGLTLVEVPTH